MSAKHIPKRSDDQTRLSFSLSKELREKIEHEAANQRRTMSNLITVLLEEKFAMAEQPEEYQGKDKRADQPAPPARTPIKYSGRSTKQTDIP